MLSNEFSLSEYTKIDDPTGGTYSPPPDPLACFKGAASLQERSGGEGCTRWREKKGMGEWGRRGTGEVGGIAPWLLGG